jgi:hypothetical protein
MAGVALDLRGGMGIIFPAAAEHLAAVVHRLDRLKAINLAPTAAVAGWAAAEEPEAQAALGAAAECLSGIVYPPP